jgi:hypothetical protein
MCLLCHCLGTATSSGFHGIIFWGKLDFSLNESVAIKILWQLKLNALRLISSKINEYGIWSYKLDDQGVGVQVLEGARIFTFPCRPERL